MSFGRRPWKRNKVPRTELELLNAAVVEPRFRALRHLGVDSDTDSDDDDDDDYDDEDHKTGSTSSNEKKRA